MLLSDGYAAYASYAKQVGLTHAQCWAHARREVLEAKDVEPAPAEEALAFIGVLYEAESHIRQHKLEGAAKRAWRQAHAKPAAQRFFKWIERHFEAQGFLPSSPFTKALNYIRERRAGLEVYLDDADVAIDTNHSVAIGAIAHTSRRLSGTAGHAQRRASRSAMYCFISLISLRWVAIMPSASLRTRGSVMRARPLVRMAIE